jgi:hypothetical protein
MDRFFENDDPEKENEFFSALNGEDIFEEINEKEINQHLISKAIQICEKGFLWKFKSIEKKMYQINVVYEWLKLITEN